MDSGPNPSSSGAGEDDPKPESAARDDPNPEPKPKPASIDQSLDALENQLASIKITPLSKTTPFDDEEAELEQFDDDDEDDNDDEQQVGQVTTDGVGSQLDSISDSPKPETTSLKEDEIVEVAATDGAGSKLESIMNSRNLETVSVNEEGEGDQRPTEQVPVADEKEVSNVLGMKASSSSLSVWRNSSEVEEVERPSSPSSSGYAGERGSSGGATSRGDDDEDDEIREVVENGGSQEQWTPGKRHVDEDDASVSWRKRKKHFFILSHSGKPIYSRYGDEHKLAGFSATLQAIISFVENGGDRVKLVRAGKHQVVFLVKGPIYLVCISCTEEPYESLRGQLELLYGQMILILTKSVNRCFEKNPKFDMTPLLGGTDVVFSSLIHSFSWNPATFLHAYTCLPLPYATRQAAGAILQDVAESGVLFALLMCRHKVVSLVSSQKASLHPDDMMLLSNFIMSSESFRTSESFSPICLPRYNSMAFLYAYVHYFDVDTYLLLLTTDSTAFYHLKDCRILVEAVLLKSNVLGEVQRSMLDGGMHVENVPEEPGHRIRTLFPYPGHSRPAIGSPERTREAFVGIGGPAGLWHFIYRSIALDQYVQSEFSSPISSSKQQKRLYRAYEKLYASMHDKGTGTHKTQFRRDENYVLLCWVTQDFELYAAFDPLADKALAIKTCNRVCQWVKDVENEIFLLGASPFSW